MSTLIMIKRYEINDMIAAIKSLEGRLQVVTDPDGKTIGVVIKPYDLPMKIRVALAKTLRSLLSEINDYENNKFGEKPDSKELNNFMKEEIQVEVYEIMLTDLKIDTNQISPQVISNLLPIIVE